MKKISPRKSSEKTSADSIKDVPRVNVESAADIHEKGIYSLRVDNVDLDVAYLPRVKKTGSRSSKKAVSKEYLFVFFCGPVDRATTDLPAFQRWSWHTDFPGSCLFISDPFLAKTQDLGLGWYIGEKTKDAGPVIAKLVTSIAEKNGISSDSIVLYGSGSGGFAALRTLVDLPDARAIAINPQTKLTHFEGGTDDPLSKYIDVFFEGMSKADFEKNHSYRNTINSRIGKIENSRIVYVQNRSDAHHMDHHLTELFTNQDGNWVPRKLKNATLVFFDDSRGHGVAEPISMVPALLKHCGISA